MKRLPVPRALAAAAAVVLLCVAGARGAVTEREYAGSQDNGRPMGFDIKKTSHGKKIKNVFAEIEFTCDGGDPGGNVAFLDGSFRVAKDDTFGGRTTSTVQPFTDPKAKLTGKLRPHHKAKGTIRVHGELDPVDQPGLNCDTGTVDWKAEKRKER